MRAMNPTTDPLLARAGRPRSLREIVFSHRLTMLVLAPHPDDFDAISATLRHLHGQGHELHVAVLTTGANGVDDGYAGAADRHAKAAVREAEQRASCALFGLPPGRLHFLRLWEHGTDLVGSSDTADRADLQRLAAWLAARPADLLFMPHGHDTNRTHRRTYESVRALAAQQRMHRWACLNQDAKTLALRPDLYFDFDEQEAAWKRQLLLCHGSQQQRNLRTRGVGFDERVLGMNRRAAGALAAARPYAEVFELLALASEDP